MNTFSQAVEAAREPDAAMDPVLVQQLDRMLDELSVASQATSPRPDFYSLVLTRLQIATAAKATAVWLPGPEGVFLPAFAQGLSALQAELTAARRATERQWISDKAADDRPFAYFAGGHGGPVVVHHLQALDRVHGILAVYRPEGEPAAVTEGLRPLMAAIGEIIVDYERNFALRTIETQLELQRQLVALSAAMHECRNSTSLAYTIANDGRQFLGCDRVSVFKYGGGARHVASSSVTRVDRRSQYSRRLTQLVGQLARCGQPFAFPYQQGGVPRRVESLVDRFVSEHSLESFFFVPLKSRRSTVGGSRTTGAFTAEFQSSGDVAAAVQRLGMVERHVAIAWENRYLVERNPLRGVGGALAAIGSQFGVHRLPRTVVVLGLVAALLATLILIQREFRIEVDGELVPVSRPHVWAPIDGIVQNVLVTHGADVEAGSVLAELISPELDLQLQEAAGQLASARRRREGFSVALRQAELEKDNPPAELVKISAEIAEIDAEIENLEGRQKFLEGLRDKLTIRSPIAGQVITWNVAELLANRPVRKGESLMSVGDTAGEWQVEFRLPDRELRYVTEAQRQFGEDLPVACMLAGDPRNPLEGRIETVGTVANAPSGTEPEITVVARLERSKLVAPRVGMSITGRIYCGRRSLWYIGTYELVDAVRRRFFW